VIVAATRGLCALIIVTARRNDGKRFGELAQQYQRQRNKAGSG